MAVIIDDSPAQQKVSAADLPVIAIASPPQTEGFSTDKSKKFFPPSDIDQDSDQKSISETLEVTTEPPGILPAQNEKKKRRQRKRRRKKMKTVVLIRGPRVKRGLLSGKFHLKLPKKAIGNRLLVVALCSFIQYQLAHSGSPPSTVTCNNSVPVSDLSIILNHKNQNVIFRGNAQPEIVYNVVPIALWVKHGDGTLGRIICEDCDNFVKKSHLMKKFKKRSARVDPKVRKTPAEEKNENGTPMKTDDGTEDIIIDICSIEVPVTDFPIIVVHNDDRSRFDEATFCPKMVDIGKSCSVCFINQTALVISCRKHGDYGALWVEHGKGRGSSTPVDMNSGECHRIVNTGNIRQAEAFDVQESRENPQAGSKGRSWHDSSIFVIPLLFSIAFTSGFV